jgi:alkylation response protein AidB-like acyl-CoA dehydrogenase
MNQVAERVEMEELAQRARALIPALRARARSVEEARRVSAETTRMLRDAGLFRLMQPARFGGFEYGFTELIDIVFEIGRGCGSTAWCGPPVASGHISPAGAERCMERRSQHAGLRLVRPGHQCSQSRARLRDFRQVELRQ